MRAAMLLLVLALVPACATTSHPFGSSTPRSTARAAPIDSSRIVVTTSNDPQRPSEVVALLDIHTDADTEDKGFDELRARAAALGADAVISADFDHGDSGGKSHLSGVAVRYIKPIPAYDVLGTIDITSDPDSENKGLPELRKRAKEMGADWVVGIHFSHGEEGQQGHLTGTAVKFKQPAS